jgi:hypothetical protein
MPEFQHPEYQACIEACYACAAACDNCSTACLQEEDVKMMAGCIALDMDCADECGKHQMDHCQACAQACRRCADACLAMDSAA